MKTVLSFFLVLLAVFSLCSCRPEAKSDKLEVAASIAPLASIVSKIGGDRVNVEVIVPPNSNPHTFEPLTEHMVKFSRCRLFVYNGLGFEFWHDEFTEGTGKNIETVEFAKIPGVQIIAGHCDCCEHEHNEHGEKKEHSEACETEDMSGNPHFWLSPKNVMLLSKEIEKKLSELDPDGSAVYKQNLSSYLKELEILDMYCKESLSSIKHKKYLSQHSVWSYFARDYGLEEIGVIEESPGKEPTVAKVQALIASAKENNVYVVFTDAGFAASAANALAEDGKLKVVALDAIGLTYSDYVENMKYNVDCIKKALE